jgi:hypothetical protein
VKIADHLPLASTLKAELLEFRARINAAAHTSFEAPGGKHDDLVLALALALHWIRRTGLPRRSAVKSAKVNSVELDEASHDGHDDPPINP